MNKWFGTLHVLVVVSILPLLGSIAAGPAVAQEETLDRIKRTGVLTIGTRTGSKPFAYVDGNNQWIGFSLDLVEQLVIPAVSREVGRPVKLEKKASDPTTRIALLTSNAVDLIARTMADAPERRPDVDVSATFFYTGAQFLVKTGSPIKDINDVAGKRVGAQQNSTNARALRERVPTVQLREFQDQSAGFEALLKGAVDAWTNDGIHLVAFKVRAPNELEIVGEPYTEDPYGMAMRKGDTKFKQVVDAGLKSGFESGRYFELYEKWFGAKSETPYPLSPRTKAYLMNQIGK